MDDGSGDSERRPPELTTPSNLTTPPPPPHVPELTVAIVGSVDAGKSTLVGVLTQGQLDDGKGKMRSGVFNFPHERESGRTSSIGHTYVKRPTRIVNFIDLCGHETYLKTTVQGLTSQHPDFALVCVGTNITDMTKEHIRILHAMKIPFMFVVTKQDQTPPHVLRTNLTMLKRFASDCNKKYFEITQPQQLISVGISNVKSIVLSLQVSNVTGHNIGLLETILDQVPIQEHLFPPVFSIQRTYKVKGISGIVVSGFTGIDIKKGAELLLGPFSDGQYKKTHVRTIHNDHRENIDVLPAFSKGCLNIKWDSERRKELRSGMILTPHAMPSYKTFFADVVVFKGHSTSIRKGFNAFCNCGSIKEAVRFVDVPKEIMRSGDETSKVQIEFLTNSYFMSPETPIFLREGKLRAYAKFSHA